MKQGYTKYFKIALPVNVPECENPDIEKLFIFIGTHLPYENRNAVGSAYAAIKEKTNELLKLGRNNRIVKTSKREVASVRKIYHSILKNNIGGKLYIRIPYKLEYIFRAIIDIVEEIHSMGYKTPSDLTHLIDKTYLLAFYNRQCDAYDDIYDDIPEEMVAQRALNNDLHDPFGSLQTIFN